MKSEITLTVTGMTAGEGPILYGVEVGMNETETKGALDSDPQAENDPGSSEAAARPVWPLGQFQEAGVGTQRSFKYTWRGSPKGWSVREDQYLNFWAMNLAPATLTTGTIIYVRAKHFGVWLRD